jgi:hypothetical protein
MHFLRQSAVLILSVSMAACGGKLLLPDSGIAGQALPACSGPALPSASGPSGTWGVALRT